MAFVPTLIRDDPAEAWSWTCRALMQAGLFPDPPPRIDSDRTLPKPEEGDDPAVAAAKQAAIVADCLVVRTEMRACATGVFAIPTNPYDDSLSLPQPEPGDDAVTAQAKAAAIAERVQWADQQWSCALEGAQLLLESVQP